jgi:hypothetical protein
VVPDRGSAPAGADRFGTDAGSAGAGSPAVATDWVAVAPRPAEAPMPAPDLRSRPGSLTCAARRRRPALHRSDRAVPSSHPRALHRSEGNSCPRTRFAVRRRSKASRPTMLVATANFDRRVSEKAPPGVYRASISLTASRSKYSGSRSVPYRSTVAP